MHAMSIWGAPVCVDGTAGTVACRTFLTQGAGFRFRAPARGPWDIQRQDFLPNCHGDGGHKSISIVKIFAESSLVRKNATSDC